MESRLLEACREALASKIDPRAQIIDVGSFGPDRLDLLIERGNAQGGRARLVIDLAPARATLYLTRPAPAAPAEESVRRLLVGMWIVGVDRPAPGPLLRLLLSSPGERQVTAWLIFEWLGGRPDAVLVGARDSEVLAALCRPTGSRAAQRSRGAAYDWPAPPHRPVYERATASQVEAILRAPKDKNPTRALSRGLAGLPSYLAHEAAHRGGIAAEGTAAEGIAAEGIAEALRAIASEPFHPVLYSDLDPGLGLPASFVSPVPLESLRAYRRERPGGLFTLLAHAHEMVLRAEGLNRAREVLLRTITGEQQRLMRLHRRIEAEIGEASRAPTLRREAETLLARLTEIPRRASHFTCRDLRDPAVVLEIKLDPRLSPSANADAIFRRAKRLERGIPLRQRRMKALEEAIAHLAVLHERAQTDPRGIGQKGEGWLKEALGPFARGHILPLVNRQAGAREEIRRGEAGRRPAAQPPARRRRAGARSAEERYHPRVYKTREGWTVLVGRSNEENDYVTHVLAGPEDYWFHAHGCPGSHVVLRREGRKDNPSARTIEEVAAIAAFFSKARTSRKAPIVYTLRKYVRRPRKGPPGLALVTRERTILVEPKAPDAADPTAWGDDMTKL